jgi:hypothetical protein
MVGCLHISEFPAWALRVQLPKHHAIAVHQGGKIIARSRFLYQAGMLLSDPLERATALFPDALFFARDIPLEQAVWEGVLQRINAITPCIESFAHGVAFFEPQESLEVCQLADQLLVRIGLGPNKSISRIASVRAALGSVLQISAAAAPRFLSKTQVTVLSEVGLDDELPARFELFGLTTLDMVGALTKQHLRVQFGAAGLAVFDLLHPSPEDARVSVYVPPAVISESFALDHAGETLQQLSFLLDRIVLRAVVRLGPLCCSRITLRLRAAGGDGQPRIAQRALKAATSDAGVIGRAASHLLQQALDTPLAVSSLELSLGGLKNSPLSQASLFFERPPLRPAVMRIEERFPGKIWRALLIHPDAPFPEDRTRLVPFSE